MIICRVRAYDSVTLTLGCKLTSFTIYIIKFVVPSHKWKQIDCSLQNVSERLRTKSNAKKMSKCSSECGMIVDEPKAVFTLRAVCAVWMRLYSSRESGRLFQTSGQQTEKARLPNCVLVRQITSDDGGWQRWRRLETLSRTDLAGRLH